MALNAGIADAYSATGQAWQDGPGRIYDRLADVVVAASPIALRGALVLDVGAGTGAASRAAARAGAGTVVAVDAAAGMLAVARTDRPPAVVADAVALPLAAGAFDAAIAAFSLNHLLDPIAGLGEMARVCRPGGAVVCSAYATDDAHPVRDAVRAAAVAHGWQQPAWEQDLRQRAIPLLATPERAAAAARLAGLDDVTAARREVWFPDLTPTDLVVWRLGMAQLAPFVAGLAPAARADLVADALDRLGDDVAPLRRSLVVAIGRVRD